MKIIASNGVTIPNLKASAWVGHGIIHPVYEVREMIGSKLLKNWKYILIVCAVILSVLWLIFGEHGLLYLKQRKIDLEEYTQRVQKQEQKKSILEQELKRLQTDKEYMEQVIREETGKIKKNEVRIVISKENEGESSTAAKSMADREVRSE